MKILLACEFYFPSVGGVQRVMQEIAEGLVRRGHEVMVVTSALVHRVSLIHQGVKIQEFSVTGNQVWGMHGDISGYQSFLVESKFDVLLVNAAQQWTFDAMIPILGQIRIKKVHIPCGYSGFMDSHYQDYFTKMPAVLRQFDHLIYHASQYRDIDFAKRCGLERYSVIPNGASEKEFSDVSMDIHRAHLPVFWQACEGKFVVLSIGNPVLEKGHAEVLLAYRKARLAQPSVLILVGDYPQWRSIAATLKRYLRYCLKPKRYWKYWSLERVLRNGSKKLSRDKQVFQVKLPRSQILSLFFQADLFVFASHIEYSPLVLFECAAAGLPYLTVDVGNASEIVNWTLGGAISSAMRGVDAQGRGLIDSTCLAKEMANMIHHPDQLIELSAAGRKHWRSHFTWDKIVEHYEKIFTEVTAR